MTFAAVLIGGAVGVGAGMAGGAAVGIAAGTAAMSIYGAYANKGPDLQSSPSPVTKYGKGISKVYTKAADAQIKKATSGQSSEGAFNDVSTSKMQEAARNTQAQDQFVDITAKLGNTGETDRGGMAGGGKLAKAAVLNAGQRQAGLFAPVSILNMWDKNELMRGIEMLRLSNEQGKAYGMSVFNANNQQAMVNNALSIQKGQAIGSAISGIGGAMLNNAYFNRMQQGNNQLSTQMMKGAPIGMKSMVGQSWVDTRPEGGTYSSMAPVNKLAN